MNGFQKIFLSEKSVFCLIVILLSCVMSIILKSVAPFVSATTIIAPVWTYTKSMINCAAITAGIETAQQPTLQPPPPPVM